MYSDVPNKCAVRLSIVGIKIHEFTFIRHYITVSKIACMYDLLFRDCMFIRHYTFTRNIRVVLEVCYGAKKGKYITLLE